MTNIVLKKLYGEDRKAKVGKILIKDGDLIKIGDGLFNAESSKGNFLVKSEYEGKILRVLIQEGQQIKIGDVIAELEGEAGNNAPEKPAFSYNFGLAKPKKENISCDIAIIGGGPGGYIAAIRAAQLGASVTLIEKDRIGGTCLNYGCIPTKCFVKCAHLRDDIAESEKFGIQGTLVGVDMEQIVRRKNNVVSTLTDGIEHLLEHWKIKIISGEAKVSKDEIAVSNSKVEASIKAKKIIIAAGSSAAKLQITGADLPIVLTNKEILNIRKIPETLTVIGGGVIGMEFAFIFSSLGSKVTVLEYMDNILSNLDDDIIDIIMDECSERGISIFTGAKTEEIMMAENGQGLSFYSVAGERHCAVSDLILMSVGRRANLDSIDFASLGIELNERENGIKVDADMKTSCPDIYAIGDITNILQLAHVASHQGIVAAENCMGLNSEMDYSAIPSAVFLSPEIGVVGLCEKEAEKAGIAYKISKFPFAANGKALSLGEPSGFVKVISHAEDNRILGAAVIGPGATDLISNFTYFIKEKVDVRTLKHLVFAHPTAAEAVHEAILGIEGESLSFAQNI